MSVILYQIWWTMLQVNLNNYDIFNLHKLKLKVDIYRHTYIQKSQTLSHVDSYIIQFILYVNYIWVYHCTYTALLEKSNVRGVPIIERFLLTYWSVLYKALLEKTKVRGAPINERFILNGIFLTEPYNRTVQ